MDEFLMESRLIAVEVALPENGDKLLAVAVRDFFRAGGVLLWSDWAKMSDETRAVFLRARAEAEAERMLALASVFAGPPAPKERKELRDEDAVSAALDAVRL